MNGMSYSWGYWLAKELSDTHPETTAFYRFSDFDNYYSLRKTQDEYIG